MSMKYVFKIQIFWDSILCIFHISDGDTSYTKVVVLDKI